MVTRSQVSPLAQARIRPLREDDLPAADRVFRLAFGTFLGLPDPMQFAAGAEYVRTRWRADPEAAFGAELDGEIVGSVFATNWGSIGFFGPLTVHPNLWDRGIAKQLLVPVMETFERWGTRHAGLFTFAHSTKHVGLYQKFGFWPRFLTAIMSKPVSPGAVAAVPSTLSRLAPEEQNEVVRACARLTGSLYEGLDVSAEIFALRNQELGETVLLKEEGELAALAVCHCGGGTEAGNDTCYIKFAAVRPGKRAERSFEQLLHACEGLAREQKLARVVGGINLARHRAYRQMLACGFRTQRQGVTMHRPNAAGYDRPAVFLIDDWR